jgi:hypothetical protein
MENNKETDRAGALITTLQDAEAEAEAKGHDYPDSFKVIEKFFGKPLDKLLHAERLDAAEALGFIAEIHRQNYEQLKRLVVASTAQPTTGEFRARDSKGENR